MLGGKVMKALNLQTMPIDDLWQLRENLGLVLAEQLASEKHKLEQRLSRVQADLAHPSLEPQRRTYPKVHPKYQNPDDPSQTWTGRGRAPHWINEKLKAGKGIDDLRIDANKT